MTAPLDDIEGCLAAHARLLDTVAGIDDEIARRPSLLPGWTVGHVVTHLARNADSVTVRMEGALRDEIADQYPGGPAAREAGIEAGAGRPARELLHDLRVAQARLEATFVLLPDDAWGRLGRDISGAELPVSGLPFARWREVEIHHVDLGLGYGAADWPTDLVDRLLPFVLPTLPDRADGAALAAWAIGRGPAPELGPWR